jgi:hypothetical protein
MASAKFPGPARGAGAAAVEAGADAGVWTVPVPVTGTPEACVALPPVTGIPDDWVEVTGAVVLTGALFGGTAAEVGVPFD